MRLDDALLQWRFALTGMSLPAARSTCSAAIECGVDMICVKPLPDITSTTELLTAVHESCRNLDALFILESDPELAADLEPDGVHIPEPGSNIGTARVWFPGTAIVGLTTTTPDEALLARELAADYATHRAGAQCIGHFRSLGAGGNTIFFAGGLSGLDEAAHIVDGGIYRLGVETDPLMPITDLTAELTAYSRLLGRSV